jgi:hypothetical protein
MPGGLMIRLGQALFRTTPGIVAALGADVVVSLIVLAYVGSGAVPVWLDAHGRQAWMAAGAAVALVSIDVLLLLLQLYRVTEGRRLAAGLTDNSNACGADVRPGLVPAVGVEAGTRRGAA